MDLLQLGAQSLTQQMGGSSDSNALQDVLGSLIGDGDSMGIGSLVAKMQGGGAGGLGEIVQSWLDDGENASISLPNYRRSLTLTACSNRRHSLAQTKTHCLKCSPRLSRRWSIMAAGEATYWIPLADWMA